MNNSNIPSFQLKLVSILSSESWQSLFIALFNALFSIVVACFLSRTELLAIIKDPVFPLLIILAFIAVRIMFILKIRSPLAAFLAGGLLLNLLAYAFFRYLLPAAYQFLYQSSIWDHQGFGFHIAQLFFMLGGLWSARIALVNSIPEDFAKGTQTQCQLRLSLITTIFTGSIILSLLFLAYNSWYFILLPMDAGFPFDFFLVLPTVFIATFFFLKLKLQGLVQIFMVNGLLGALTGLLFFNLLYCRLADMVFNFERICLRCLPFEITFLIEYGTVASFILMGISGIVITRYLSKTEKNAENV
ncbi:MAG: hypothetical protein PHW04_17770 [Candidatus Wallbacteria bacterium]|nr:hypothetical protein [Candidatus Wallbacteria bacterium]